MRLVLRSAAACGALASLAMAMWFLETPLFVVGMIGFVLFPFLMRVPLGAVRAVGDGTRTFTGRTWAAKVDRFARLVGTAAWGLVGWAALAAGDHGALLVTAVVIGLGCSMVALYGLGALLYAPEEQAESVTLDRDTLTLRGFAGTHVIRYLDIVAIEAAGRSLWITLANERHVFAVEPNAKSLASAIESARAQAILRRTTARTDTTELERPSGMGAREWLARIDALSAARAMKDAYRRSGKDEDEDERLLAVMDSVREDVTVRAAAARLLASSSDPGVRLRVAERAETIEDDAVRTRVKLVMQPDAEDVAREFEALELEELRREAGR